MIALSAVEAQLVRLAVGRRDLALRAAEQQFAADVKPVLDVHQVIDGEFVGQDDGSVALVAAFASPPEAAPR